MIFKECKTLQRVGEEVKQEQDTNWVINENRDDGIGNSKEKKSAFSALYLPLKPTATSWNRMSPG